MSYPQILPEYQECLLTDTGFTVNYLDNAFAFPKGSPFRWHLYKHSIYIYLNNLQISSFFSSSDFCSTTP